MTQSLATSKSGPAPVAQDAREARRGALLVFGAALVWSFGGAIARGLETADPWTIIAWRSIFAALFLMAFMLWRDGPAGTWRLQLGLQVAPNGRVGEEPQVQLVGAPRGVVACVAATLRSTRFPRAGAETQIELRFDAPVQR